MAPSPSAQLDLTRRYARELRRLQTEARSAVHNEARSAFQKSDSAFRSAARDLRNGVIPGGSDKTSDVESDEIAPGIGHA